MGLVVTLAGVLDPHRVRRPERHDQVRWVVGVRDFWLADDRLGQAVVVAATSRSTCLAQVVAQVPPVGELDRVGRTVTGAVRVSAGRACPPSGTSTFPGPSL